MGARPLTDQPNPSRLDSVEAWLSRPLWAEVDLDAVKENVRSLKDQAGSSELMAMVKANAYGHGAVAVARAALASGASRLGVAALDEAIQLRMAGINAPVLVVGDVSPARAEQCVELDITATANSLRMGRALSAAARKLGQSCRVHVKADTGLNRYGLGDPEIIDLANALRRLPGIEIEAIYTHFATADEADKGFTREQVRRFRSVTEQLDWIPLKHCSNSAGLLELREFNFDIVRPGISLYGLYPSAAVERRVHLRPALSLKARIVRVHEMAPNETTSYGRRWQAKGGETVALVPCGYGDGYPRLLSNMFHVWIEDQLCPIRGTIAMDQMVVDITSTTAAEGTEVTVLGGHDGSGVSATEIAERASTISYEVTTSISARVPRIFLEGGKPVAAQGLNDRLPVDLMP
ncbi:MAG TPA: alanine racemase [Dehalococcoidia bacterium]|nr:alanine racemase [Dehalococcoidia bacterium]